MEAYVEVLKTLGLVSGSTAVVAGIAVTLLRYLLKSSEQKNNIISNHIQHSIEAIIKNTDVLEKLDGSVRETLLMLTEMRETLRQLRR